MTQVDGQRAVECGDDGVDDEELGCDDGVRPRDRCTYGFRPMRRKTRSRGNPPIAMMESAEPGIATTRPVDGGSTSSLFGAVAMK